MPQPLLTCPHCGSDIALTETIAAGLLADERAKLLQRMTEERAIDQVKLESERQRLRNEAEAQAAQRIAAATAAAKTEADAKAAEQARLAAAVLDEYKAQLAAREAALTEAQGEQAKALRMQRELADAQRALEVTIESRVTANLEAARSRAKAEAEEALRLRVAERDETIAALQRKIEDLGKRAEQGSQQLQGEVLEAEIETLLRSSFPLDTVTPVAKGAHGGDIVQRVRGPGGLEAGTILWECKRTKNWSDGWLPKLRDDQRAAHAELAVLLSSALPAGVADFAAIDGVWVGALRLALPLATVLRQGLIDTALARGAAVGQATKVELIYSYLTGSAFRRRVEALIEAFEGLQQDLADERKLLTKQWAKREAQIARMMQATTGMYGDLQGIAGAALPELAALDVRQLAAAT